MKTKNASGWAIWDHDESDFWAAPEGEVLWETKGMAVECLKEHEAVGCSTFGYFTKDHMRFSVLFATITQNCEHPEEYI